MLLELLVQALPVYMVPAELALLLKELTSPQGGFNGGEVLAGVDGSLHCSVETYVPISVNEFIAIPFMYKLVGGGGYRGVDYLNTPIRLNGFDSVLQARDLGDAAWPGRLDGDDAVGLHSLRVLGRVSAVENERVNHPLSGFVFDLTYVNKLGFSFPRLGGADLRGGPNGQKFAKIYKKCTINVYLTTFIKIFYNL